MSGRLCPNCNNPIRPKPVARGGIEAPSQTKARRFCNKRCWREFLRNKAHTTGADKLIRLEKKTLALRRFVGGDAIWYTRTLTESFGWPVRVPAEFMRYLDDYGRSRVLIMIYRRDGTETPAWTTERKLSPRKETFAKLQEATLERRKPGRPRHGKR